MKDKKYRNGCYAEYYGKIFDVRFCEHDNVVLLTFDRSFVAQGFIQAKYGRYEKRVYRSELANIFDITTIGTYCKYDFFIVDERNDMVLLFKPKEVPGIICFQMGFQNSEPGVYEKWVKCDEVTNIHEVSTPL